MESQDIMSLFRTRCVSVYLCLLIQTVSGHVSFVKMNLTQVPVSHINPEETWIRISRTQINLVEDNAFVLFPRLRYLYLDSNQISFLSDLAFNGTSIQDLDLSFNKLTALPRFASIGFSLQYLEASYNLIEHIGSDEFKGVTGLLSLRVYWNRLTFIHSDAFSDCANTLSQLALSSNRNLTSMPAEIFRGMGQLSELHITKVALPSFPDFRYLPANNSIATLRISSNHISDLTTNDLNKLGKLNDFSLGSRGVNKVPDFSRHRGILQKVRFLETNISDIPNTAFDNLPLRELRLSSNRFTRLPNLQSIQSTLELLDLSRNELSTVTCEEIHEMIANCPLLVDISFKYAYIKTFPDILQYNRSFRSINLSNRGTMRCDCAMEWMIGLEGRVNTDIEGTSLLCGAPPRLVGRKWATINRTDLCHDNEAVSCNFKPPLMSTTTANIPILMTTTIDIMAMTSQDYRNMTRTHLIDDNSRSGVLPTEGTPDETVGSNILAAALGGTLGVVFMIVVIVVVVLVCRIRSSSSSNKSRDNMQERGQ